MAYIALYRQWRPEKFADLVGQTGVSRTLSQAITSGRIGHAYLFSGPRGTGKTSTAKIFAKSLNCEKGPTLEPCGVCESCRKIANGTALDVFEIDAASNRGIDEMRDLREKVKFIPAEGRYKVYIIDEVHMLTAEAFNALLKTLEEPPTHVVFILATTEPHKVPATIQSRCQRFDFRRITVEDIEKRLAYVAQKMQIPCEKAALHLLAQQADGGMRDGLSLLDQCASFTGEMLTAAHVEESLGLVGRAAMERLIKLINKSSQGEILDIIATLLSAGKDPMQILTELTLYLRSLMIYEAAGALSIFDFTSDAKAVLEEQRTFFTQAQLMEMLKRLHEAMAELRWTPQPRITLEVALLSLCGEQKAADNAANADLTQPTAIDAAHIARLEAELSSLKAAFLAQNAAIAASTANDSILPAPKTTSKKAAAASLHEIKTTSSKQKNAASNLSAPSVPNPEGEKIYANLLRFLQEQERFAVLACLKGAAFAGIYGNVFHLRFDSPLLARRTARDDYKKLIESALSKIQKEPLTLSCEAIDKVPTPPKKAQLHFKNVPLMADSKPPLINKRELSSAERSHLEKAVTLLGGRIVDLPQERRIAALAASGKVIFSTEQEKMTANKATRVRDEIKDAAMTSANMPSICDDVPPPRDDDAPDSGKRS